MSTDRSATPASCVLCAAGALSLAMVLVPPFTSVSGTEYAFALTGPAWSRSPGLVGTDLGLEARLHWSLLAIQFVALWTVALGARWAFARRASVDGT